MPTEAMRKNSRKVIDKVTTFECTEHTIQHIQYTSGMHALWVDGEERNLAGYEHPVLACGYIAIGPYYTAGPVEVFRATKLKRKGRR